MGEKLVIGPINKGLRTDRTAFVIDNDSFPTLINAYQWRGRIKRKRGTQFLTRLQRNVIISAPNNTNNLLQGLESTSSLVPGTINITDSTLTVYTDPNQDGTLSPSGTINYSTGVVTGPTSPNTGNFSYYPELPVMGLKDFVVSTQAFPGTIGFDTVYAYNIMTANPYTSYDVSFYKNPTTNTSFPSYTTPKTIWTKTTWNSKDYQQIWTVNYQGALWATNGVTVPFDPTNIGMQFKIISGISIGTAGNGTTVPAVATITITAHGLSVGDFLFINEVSGITGINFQTGYVTVVVDANNVTLTFPKAILGGSYSSSPIPGIAQYLTNRSDITKDCLRWYDGDPTDGNPESPTFILGKGWVNFAPPLSQFNFSISDEPQATYYLVGARMIIPFKDRLLFLGPVIQTSSLTSSPIYLQDTVIFSENGTPYYTGSFNGDVLNPKNLIPILVPVNQTATPSAFFEDQTGFGGYIQAGVDQPINTAAFNEDVIIIGFSNFQTRLAYTGNDLIPFNFFSINTEFGSSSTFSTVTMDQGVLTRGSKGYLMTSQTGCERIDLDIPDQVFEVNLKNNGTERFCSFRDYINEWIYFTYPNSSVTYNFPNQTLQFNYRDNSWAIFNECYTTYGSFRKSSGFTWATVYKTYPSWNSWNDAWNSGVSQLFQPLVIGGNQKGFVLIRGVGTYEGQSISITSFSGNTVTSPNHCFNDGDYIIINNCTGTIASQVNGLTFSIANATTNTFNLIPSESTTISGTYFGLGTITRLYVPFIQTKQFPIAWSIGRKIRLGPQQYLLTTTAQSEITLLIYLSQNASSAYNIGSILPSENSINNALIYSTVLYTCPESTNLGLTPSNVNLQMPTAYEQEQIWHRINTSLLGDTVQLGFTLSDAQMRVNYPAGPPFTITGATKADPCVLSCISAVQVGQTVLVDGIVGMTELNGYEYVVVAVDATTVSLDVDSTTFGTYISGGKVTQIAAPNATAEIELHSCILDLTPSQMLA